MVVTLEEVKNLRNLARKMRRKIRSCAQLTILDGYAKKDL